MKTESIFRIGPKMAGVFRGELDAIGGKAFGLARLAELGIPVPPGFVLGTAHCRQWLREKERHRKVLAAILREQMHWLQGVTGLGFGDPRSPLLVSVRSGAPVSMPGMMDTLLNIGLTDDTIHGLLRMTGQPRLVWDCYRRLIRSFAETVFRADPRPFDTAQNEQLARERAERVSDLDYQSLADLAHTYLRLCNELTGNAFPQNPLDQLELAVQAVFASWDSARAVHYRRLFGIPDELCTAATVQRMVFGNRGLRSGSGVGFTRNPASGEKGLYFDFLFNSQGEDIVSGRTLGSDTERLFAALPGIREELTAFCSVLEGEFRDAQEFECTLEEGDLYLLQSRSAKRTPWAALRIAVEQVREGLIGPKEALARLEGIELGGIVRQVVVPNGRPAVGGGEPSGVGVAVGALSLDIDQARAFAAEGRPAVLVREDMSTNDIAGIGLCAGVLTARGNRTSHAAVVARQLGKPCVTGCTDLGIDASGQTVSIGGETLAVGEIVTLDANTGHLYRGERKLVLESPSEWLEEVRCWGHCHPAPGGEDRDR